ncbi:MAG: hypothetical protein M0P20_09960 [Methanocorpusculum sp.]|nr:hypothetical protein [Methanocorpusculum sp.]
MDKLAWCIEFPPEKGSSYTVADYVINDLGIFARTEKRTKKTGAASQLWGFRVGMNKVKGTDYLAQAGGRQALLWQKISGVTIGDNQITVRGNRDTKIQIFCTAENFAEVSALIQTMRAAHPMESGPSIDAAGWICWEQDEDWEAGESLDDMITTEISSVERYIESDILEETIIP